MRNVSLALLAVVALTVAACAETEGSGDVRVGVSTAALTADVTRVELTVSGAGISPDIVQALTQDPGDEALWSADLIDIPAGTGHVFTARAYDLGDVLLYEGSATADINDGAQANVLIILNEVAPTGFSNVAPRFTSLVVEANPVQTGQTVELTAAASDPDETVGLSYGWSAAGGTFNPASGPVVDWTAPATAGDYQITVTVTDSPGASSDLVFVMTVESNPVGTASVTAQVNNAPVVHNLIASDGQVDAGETVDLTLDVSDPESDAMTFAWSADCDGSFSDPAAQNPSFTLNTLPAGDPPADCTVSVQISDDPNGASNTASLSLATGPDVAPDVAVGQQQAGTVYVNVPLMAPTNPNYEWALAAASSNEVVVGAVDSSQTPRAQRLELLAPDAPLWTTGTGATGSNGVDVSVDPIGTTHLLARFSGTFRLTRIAASGSILAGNIPVSTSAQPFIFDTAAMPDGSTMVAYTSGLGLSVLRVDSAGTPSPPQVLQTFTGSMTDQVKVLAINDDFYVSATAGNGNLEFFAHVDAADTIVTNTSNFTLYGLPLFAIGLELLPSGELSLIYRDANNAVVGGSFNFDGTPVVPANPVTLWIDPLPGLRPAVVMTDENVLIIVGYSGLSAGTPGELRTFAPLTAAPQWNAVLEDPDTADGLPVAHEVTDIVLLPNNDICVLGTNLSGGNRQLSCFNN